MDWEKKDKNVQFHISWICVLKHLKILLISLMFFFPVSPVFHSELMDTLKRAKEENISSENLILEINSLK